MSPETAMQTACAEARKWLGATSPNPAVGAVALDAAGNLVAVTAHRHTGELHAEAQLIENARRQNVLEKIHTLYVTLEPCNHSGRTPPCTEAIVQSGIKHVIVGTRDPNPHVKGGGIERLREAGVQVTCGIGEEECKQLIHAFAYSVRTGTPWITVKRAIDAKGSMIPPAGEKTFTSPDSLRLAHRLRKKADGILTGSGTILADNPLFNVRHVPDYPEKRRWLAILDRRGRVSDQYLKATHERGLNPVIYQDINSAIKDLAAREVRDIMVEAGPALSQTVLDAGLWTMAVTFRQTDPDDEVEVEFNQASPISFDTGSFRWEWFLPG